MSEQVLGCTSCDVLMARLKRTDGLYIWVCPNCAAFVRPGEPGEWELVSLGYCTKCFGARFVDVGEAGNPIYECSGCMEVKSIEVADVPDGDV